MTGRAPRMADLFRYLGFDAGHQECLRELASVFDPTPMIDDFYSKLLADPEARKVLRDEQLVAGLRVSLVGWAERVLSGPWDDAYHRHSQAIGRRHVEVGLPQRFMPLAMNVVRVHVRRAAVEQFEVGARRELAIDAVDKVLDLELTIMLGSYHEDTLERTRDTERSRAIGQLAGGVGHELKTPLGVIQTNLALVREAAGDELRPVLERPLERIARGARVVGDFANRLLEFSRVKSPRRRPFPVRVLLDEAVGMIGDTAGVEVVVELGAGAEEGFGDPGDLTRAVADLVGNGVAACREHGGGTVVVRARREGGILVLEVIDDGPGIEAGLHERIFEPLFTTRDTATGLGLALCRELVEAHGGQLEVDSEVGRGARFVIRLPSAPA